MKTAQNSLFTFVIGLLLSSIATHAQVAGSLDLGFDPNAGGGGIRGLAVQPDGKLLIGGLFTTIGGQPRSRIARLNADGTLESTVTFNPGTGADNSVENIAVQPDGRILLVGNFITVNGQTRNRFARLNPDGTLETTATFNPGTGANNTVFCVALQTDGHILLVGNFTTINGQTRNRIARLNPDGTLESTATFNPGTGANGAVNSVALQPDGHILMGGAFTIVNGVTSNRIARLNPDGTLETAATFNPGVGVNNSVSCVTLQADGKILIGGTFTTVDNQARTRLARLLPNGAVEGTATFNPGTGADDTVICFAMQTDGKIVVTGRFGNINGQPRGRVARLNADGTVESTATFNSGTGAPASSFLTSIAIQPSGRIVIGGGFFSMNGVTRNYIARLYNDAVTESLTIPDRTRVQWARGGAAAETQHVGFELSTDGGANWSTLGAGTRIAGGMGTHRPEPSRQGANPRPRPNRQWFSERWLGVG